MDIVITSWALDSYLELKHKNQFSEDDYKNTIRPDAMLLKSFPASPNLRTTNSGLRLLHASVKTDPKAEARQLAKFKTRLELIRRGQFTECGRLS